MAHKKTARRSSQKEKKKEGAERFAAVSTEAAAPMALARRGDSDCAGNSHKMRQRSLVKLTLCHLSALVFGLRFWDFRQVSHEIARSNLSTFLTPSSIAAELRPDLDPVAAAAIYTGEDLACLCVCISP